MARKWGPNLGPKKVPNIPLALVASLLLCSFFSLSCASLYDGQQPVVVEQSYSPAPVWLDQKSPQRTADGSILLVYRSPAVPDLDLAANQLNSKIAMHTKEQLSSYFEAAFVAAQPEPASIMEPDRSAFSQAVAQEVAKGIGGGVIQLQDYYYRKLKWGNRPAVAEVFALVQIPRPAVNGLVAAIADTLRQSPSSTLRSLAGATAKADL